MSDTPTLVERLRHAAKNAPDAYMNELHGRAADQIEYLTEANEILLEEAANEK